MSVCRACWRAAWVSVAMLTACQRTEEGYDGVKARGHALHAVVHQVVGSVGGEKEDAFGRISGLAVHPTGVVVATDDQVDEIIVVSAEGRVNTKIDGTPAGPGHFGSPCCISFDREGHIWIYGRNDRRFIGFDLEGNLIGEKGQGILFIYAGRPLMFDAEGGYMIRAARPPRLIHVRADGDTLAFPTPAAPAADIVVTIVGGDGREAALAVPFATRALVADRSDGYLARASSARYAVEVYDEKGVLAWSVRQEHEAPELSRQQRDSALALREAYGMAARRSGGTVTAFEIPDRNQVLERIWFDSTKRLWIQVTTRGENRATVADVYSEGGDFLFAAMWPDTVSLSYGAIRGSQAWGLTKGENGIDVIVRMSFDSAREGTRR